MKANQQQSALDLGTVMILTTVILLSMMEVLDMTVVNVALPVMMGSLHVNIDSITWLITAYIIASAIIMPATGSLVNKLGCRKILLFSIFGFALASAMCGLSNNFDVIVVFRVLQGLCGASLVPLSQYIIINSVSKKNYATVIAIWGGGITIAPILGPALGGLVIKNFSWHFLFLMNIPISIVAFILIYILLEKSKEGDSHVFLDYQGFILLAITIGCGLFVLNRGEYLGWLTSKFVVYLLVITCLSSIGFVIRGLVIKNKNIIDFSLFANKKFSISTLLIIIISAIVMGMGAIMPIFLERFLNFSPEIVGIINIPSGIAMVVAMGFAGVFLKLVDARWIILLGVFISAYATRLLSKINLSIDESYIIYLYCIRGFGFGLCFIPVLAVAFMNLDEKFIAVGTGVFNFARNIGSSVGVTLASSNLNGLVQAHWHHLVGNVSAYSLNYQLWLNAQSIVPNLTYNSPLAIALSTSEVVKNSYMLAFSQLLLIFSGSLLLCIPFVLFLGKARVNKVVMAG